VRNSTASSPPAGLDLDEWRLEDVDTIRFLAAAGATRGGRSCCGTAAIRFARWMARETERSRRLRHSADGPD